MYINLCQFSEEYLYAMLVMDPVPSFGRTFGMELFWLITTLELSLTLGMKMFLFSNSCHQIDLQNCLLPLSSEAFDELGELQDDYASVTLEGNSDSWSYCWGSASFSSRQY
jgi:hypothetical protein